MSDSFNALGATSFPCDAVANLTVVEDYLGEDATDEGRGMAELICFVAPGAGRAKASDRKSSFFCMLHCAAAC